MAISKIGILSLLLFSVVILLGISNMEKVEGKICPQICFDAAAYMMCPSSGTQKLAPTCNCCLAPQGCSLYYADRTLICTST
ncbi:hypothetical protein CQW23_14824 [Capsicum baccatum]|uniref:Proteinase inhibitor type-2 CEVI57 n=1 Tax=Capsicum baccatum TaxID=33114 RepID=A0A2G2WK98_CAPBA|nr:hypothetical protein CQW23_14824 [Capsicum baccatum]PHU14932.1 hypothetical protein BC332_16137 [Capsicum chinense]